MRRDSIGWILDNHVSHGEFVRVVSGVTMQRDEVVSFVCCELSSLSGSSRLITANDYMP